MGRNSGGVMSNGWNFAPIQRESKSKNVIIEKRVVALEQTIRGQRFESAIVVGKDGNLTFKKDGEKYQVKFTDDEVAQMKDAILTHNHPRSLTSNANWFSRVGTSFSKQDILLAVEGNMKGIRAVTKTYSFSMMRPKKGWGATKEQIVEAFERHTKAVAREFQDYVWGARNEREERMRIDRVTTRHFHEINKRVAKEFGWKYTKLKG